MNDLVSAAPEPADLEISYHGESQKMFEPTAARCSCSTAPCCCCCE